MAQNFLKLILLRPKGLGCDRDYNLIFQLFVSLDLLVLLFISFFIDLIQKKVEWFIHI